MRPITRATRQAAAAFALALAAPAAASAATVGYEGDTLVFRAADGEDNFVVAPSAVKVDLGDRDDHFGLGSDFPAGVPLAVHGGDGKDDISGYGVNCRWSHLVHDE
jgi:hypothetical protein